MQKNRRGNIVNVGSLLERRDISSAGGYCATKFAVVGFTEALRVELFVTGVYRGTWFNGLCYCS